jgi:hypothetical protein
MHSLSLDFKMVITVLFTFCLHTCNILSKLSFCHSAIYSPLTSQFPGCSLAHSFNTSGQWTVETHIYAETQLRPQAVKTFRVAVECLGSNTFLEGLGNYVHVPLASHDITTSRQDGLLRRRRRQRGGGLTAGTYCCQLL